MWWFMVLKIFNIHAIEYLYRMWRFWKRWTWNKKATNKQIVQFYDLASHSCEKGLWEAQTLCLCSGVALNPNSCVNYNKAMHVPSCVLADLDLTSRLDRRPARRFLGCLCSAAPCAVRVNPAQHGHCPCLLCSQRTAVRSSLSLLLPGTISLK